MSDYRVNGVHQINKWLWSKLKDWEYAPDKVAFEAYGAGGVDLVPIIPTQQVPEFTEIAGGAPFIVYNYAISPYPQDFFLCREQAAYLIYDNNEERLRAIHNYMAVLLKRMDWTAANINDWLVSGNEPGIEGDDFDFKYVRLITATGPDQYTQEGGRQGAMITISCEYTHTRDDNSITIV